MTAPDLVNGTFETLGGFTIWLNVWAMYKDKGYAGSRWPYIAFFASWGYWNLYYYPHLHQWISFAGGCNIVIANTVLLIVMLKYGRLKA